MEKLKVGILFGGRSGEHDVSLVSAQAIMAALAKNDRFEIVPIGISRSGKWLLHPDALAILAKESRLTLGGPKPKFSGDPETAKRETTALVPEGGEKTLVRIDTGGAEAGGGAKLDVIFPVLHGPMGQDGRVQGFLELAGIPYV